MPKEPIQIKHSGSRRKELERLTGERVLDSKSVGIGLLIFVLLLTGAFFWRFKAREGSKKLLEEFEFVVDQPDEEEFDLKEPQREILREHVEEVFDQSEDLPEERPDIQITTNPIDTTVREEVVRTDAVEVVEDIDVDFTDMEIVDTPQDIVEQSEEITVAIQPIAVSIDSPADIFQYREPTPELNRPLALVNRGPATGKPMKVAPAQFGDLEAPTIGELGPADVNFFGDGDYLRTMGGFGGIQARNSVDLALHWLAVHQEPGGYWVARKWDPEDVDANGLAPGEEPPPEDLDEERDQGSKNNLGVSSLAALAFMGGGHTVRKGEYRANVRRSLEWILKQQDPATGLVGGGNMYEHAIATIALCEAHGRAPDERVATAARKAVNFCTTAVGADNGWRYQPKPPSSDMSVTAWFIQALKTAKLAGVKFDYDVFARASTFVDRLTDQGGTRNSSGAVGYAYEESMRYTSRPALTCAAMMIRQFSGMGVKASLLVKGAELTKKHPPNWKVKNFYLWYYATYAMHSMGGEYRVWWNTRIRDVLLENQSKRGHQAGSWNPENDTHGAGRVYTTALGALCLEVYYRYGDALRTFGTAPDLNDLFFE